MKFTQTKKILFSALLIVILTSCKREEVSDLKTYLNYLSNPENGLLKEKTVAGITYKVKYLPGEYLAYQSIKGDRHLSTAFKDSVNKLYDNSVTFLLNISPEKGKTFDVTRVGISEYRDFAERIEQMAFYTQNMITLQVNDSIYAPVITRMENINDQQNSRNFIVVFNSKKDSENDIRKENMLFTYSDEIFSTGINKFIFKESDINKMPLFKF